MDDTDRLPGAQAGDDARGSVAAGARPARPELRGLTGLRGVAALLVVLGHLHVANLPWLNLLELQNVAVDLFFALSAFTLLYVYEPRPGAPFRYGPFMAARIARVAPMNAVSVVAAGLITAYGDPAFTARPGWLLDGLRQVLLVNGWPGLGTYKQWDLPAWSITVEALCYLVFPAWLLLDRLVARVSPSLLVTVQLVCLTASVYVSLFWYNPAANQWNAPSPGGYAEAAASVKAALGFMAGVAAYRCWAQGNIVAAAADRLCDAAAAALGIVCVLAAAQLFERQYAVLLCPALILGAAGTRSVTARVLASRPVHFLGLISYALYLVHFPVKDAFAYYASWVDPTTVPGYLAILACALLVASICHALIEKPARLLLRRAFGVWGRPRVS